MINDGLLRQFTARPVPQFHRVSQAICCFAQYLQCVVHALDAVRVQPQCTAIFVVVFIAVIRDRGAGGAVYFGALVVSPQ